MLTDENRGQAENFFTWVQVSLLLKREDSNTVIYFLSVCVGNYLTKVSSQKNIDAS